MLFEAYAEQFDKKEAQTVGKIVLRNRPLQSLLFNYICFKAENGNGVCRVSYDEIGRELEKQTGTQRSKQAISKMVHSIVALGLFEYHSEKCGAKNTIGYFRIAPMSKLYEMVAEFKEQIVIKAVAVVEAVSEAVEVGKEVVSQYVAKASEVAKKVSHNVGKVSKSVAPKGYSKAVKGRTEVVPHWFGKDEEPKAEMSEDFLRDAEEAMKRLQSL